MIENTLFLFHQQPIVFYSTIFVFGLLIGSFLNVVIFRLPKMLEQRYLGEAIDTFEWFKLAIPSGVNQHQQKFNLVTPVSTCPKCGHKIRAWENIPLISYFLLLRGKCSSCKTRISLRYPFVELITGLAFFGAAIYTGVSIELLYVLFFLAAIIALTFIDLDVKLLPDDITLLFLWVALFANVFDTFAPLKDAVIGAIAGYLSLWTIYQIHHGLTGKEGMGYGDFKMLAALGAWLGWQMLPLIILLSSAVGSIYGIWGIIMKKRGSNYQISFGPYLAIAGVIAYFWGEPISQWYWSLSN